MRLLLLTILVSFVLKANKKQMCYSIMIMIIMLIKIIIIIINLTRTRSPICHCNSPPLVDCQTDEWSTWTTCPVTCGGATKTRSKKVLQEAMNGGAACPSLQESMRCNTEMCPSNNFPLWDEVDRRFAAAPCALWLFSLRLFWLFSWLQNYGMEELGQLQCDLWTRTKKETKENPSKPPLWRRCLWKPWGDGSL